MKMRRRWIKSWIELNWKREERYREESKARRSIKIKEDQRERIGKREDSFRVRESCKTDATIDQRARRERNILTKERS